MVSSRATAAAAPGRPPEADRGYPTKNGPPTGGPFSFPMNELDLARRQHHHDLAALEPRVLLDLRKSGDVRLDLVEQLGADLLVGHFPAAIAQGDLHLVAFLEEALHRAHFHVVIVIVDHRPQLDLLDLDDFLLLAGFGGFLLRRIFVLPVVHDLADGRTDVRRNLDQIHAGFGCHSDRDHRLGDAPVLTGRIDQLNLCIADVVIDAWPVFGGSGRGSVRTANGWFSKVVNEGRYFEAIRV